MGVFRSHILPRLLLAILSLALGSCENNPLGSSGSIVTGSGSSGGSGGSTPTVTYTFLGTWLWYANPNGCCGAGTYGVQNTPDVNNRPPALGRAATWIDSSDNLWIFGGNNNASTPMNATWKFNTTTKEWTWISGTNSTDGAASYGVKGTPNTSNTPGAREVVASWKDSSGNFWLFGGRSSTANSNYNDMWRFNSTTLEWTWMSGTNLANQAAVTGVKGTPDVNNMPGNIAGACSAQDTKTGYFWLFGGYSSAGIHNNNLWRFNPTTLEWTWMSGGAAGNWGVKGTPDVNNTPNARHSLICWGDSSGNFWLFGGYSSAGIHNDLWKFNPTTSEWTWVSGASTNGGPPTFGTQGTPSVNNTPPAKRYAANWTDTAGDFWLFGGLDDAGDSWGDLWRFKPSTLEWTWVDGSNTANSVANWGAQGVSAATNTPGHRSSPLVWFDSQGNVWMRGGSYSTNYYSDVWKIR